MHNNTRQNNGYLSDHCKETNSNSDNTHFGHQFAEPHWATVGPPHVIKLGNEIIIILKIETILSGATSTFHCILQQSLHNIRFLIP